MSCNRSSVLAACLAQTSSQWKHGKNCLSLVGSPVLAVNKAKLSLRERSETRLYLGIIPELSL